MKIKLSVVVFATAAAVSAQQFPACPVVELVSAGQIFAIIGPTPAAPLAPIASSLPAIVPGEWIMVQGNFGIIGNLAGGIPRVATLQNGTFPTSLAGTEILVGGIPAPIASIDTGGAIFAPVRITAQIPSSIPVGGDIDIQLQLTSATSTTCLGPAKKEATAATAPIFYASAGSGQVIVQSSGVGVFTAYLNGLGGAPLGSDGKIATAPAWFPGSVTVSIDGKPALVSYAGLTVGTAGVNQVNFAPAGLMVPGSHTIEMLTNGVKTSGVFNSN